tara:strand:- start:827 stop:1108 length:282 start_codon:yes stop_codon:yes gene_type:complete
VDIPADVQAQIDAISKRIDDLNFDKQFISGAHARGRNDKLRSDLFSQMRGLMSPYFPREESKCVQSFRTSDATIANRAAAVARAIKQLEKGRI